MDLVKLQPRSEQCSALAQLAAQHGEGVVLDFVDLDSHLPVGHVGVAPLGADGECSRRHPTPLEP